MIVSARQGNRLAAKRQSAGNRNFFIGLPNTSGKAGRDYTPPAVYSRFAKNKFDIVTVMPLADDKAGAAAPSGFNTTHWSVISRATARSPEGRAALETLCQAYWFPVYAFARKQGCSPTDAED